MKLSITTQNAQQPSGDVLTWDTEFWGVKIGRAHTSDIDKWAKQNMVGSVCLLVDAAETADIQAAEERGFRFMDVRSTFEAKAQGRIADVRGHREDEIEKLVAIARASHRITRFYADPRFSDERCDDLYESWIRSSCAGWAERVLVAGETEGYVTIHVSEDAGSIGLIAVDEPSRGRGLGAELVCGVKGWCYEQGLKRITVITQGRNIAAQRLFQRCGFAIINTEIWLHKWYQ